MKKKGILNKQLAGLVAGLGHTDCVMICDAGFPIPRGVEYVDLAMCEGIPSFVDCLNLLFSEAIFDEITVAQEMQVHNPETFSYIASIIRAHKFNVIPQSEFMPMAGGAKFIIRTGELKPYSNIYLYSASGVEKFNRDYVI